MSKLADARQHPRLAPGSCILGLSYLALWTALGGCLRPLHLPRFYPEPPPAAHVQLLPNPLLVPRVDPDFLWEQLADSVDDYFRIASEQRVQMLGGVLTEGRIETFPETGSTALEPWRNDSTYGYERWLSTLQSVRRQARVRVIPTIEGYQVSVEVHRELEDVNQPQHSPVGAVVQRHDGTLVRPEDPSRAGPVTLGWIPIGRDTSLEQRILLDIRQRLADPSLLHVPGTRIR